MSTDEQYQRLLVFRTTLRRFDQWSRRAAEEHGLTHAQHQMLLAIRGSVTPGGPTIGEVADALVVRHHTASELADRTQQLGWVERARSTEDGRRVQLRLTPSGTRVLEELTAVHVEELQRLSGLLDPLVSQP
ncbi:MarR family winged helix-turn-helix transcriptional regulator [Nocardioides jensenii]|uniref:MarR family winged helix-turn-helix transcriptional regulator n=1 Tax=Nocardioides jensenii TaxID=1843 RepID=UPI00082BEBD8|nr:MarR family transcriptional regulator [Nocardioides jensenii]